MDNVPNTNTSYVFPMLKVTGTTNINGLQINGKNGSPGYVPVATGTGSGVAWGLPPGSTQWSGTAGGPIYYVPNVGIGASTAATAKLQVTGNLYVSNSVTTTNVYATRFVGDGGLLSNVTAVGLIQPLSNLVVSNSVTTTNVFVNGTLSVPGAMSSNIANTTFFYDTLTIPYINTQVLNVASVSVASNISTVGFTSNALNTVFNYSTLTVPFITATTLNVASTSNLGPTYIASAAGVTSLNVTGNVYVSNALTTTNVFTTNVYASGRVGIATPSPGYPLDVGSAVNIAASGNETIRSKGPIIIGNGINDGNRFISALDSTMATGDSRYFVLGKAGSVYNQAELSYTHNVDGSTSNRLNLGFFSKNVATLTAAGNMGIGTVSPTASLHVVGNVYASNALTTTNVFATSVFATNPISFRNRVTNGDFLIDQRNAGALTTPTVDGTRVIDRWKANIVGSGRCQVGQGLGGILAPAGFSSYFGMKVTTTTTVGTGDYFFLSQVIEGVDTIDWFFGQPAAKTVTLSFWVYTSITGTMGGFVRNAGTSAGNYTRSYPFTFTVNSINTWEYKTITLVGDTSGTWYRTQTDGIEFGIDVWNGTAFQSSPGVWAAGNFTGPSGGTANFAGTLNSYVYVTGVQIESGAVATPFERRHYTYELAMCQRYYETTIARLGGYNLTGGGLRSSIYFNTKKRPAASPTFTVISAVETPINMGTVNIDNSNFDGSSARIIASITTTGEGYGQWKVAVDCEF